MPLGEWPAIEISRIYDRFGRFSIDIAIKRPTDFSLLVFSLPTSPFSQWLSAKGFSGKELAEKELSEKEARLERRINILQSLLGLWQT
jgi:hypothetical protein